MSSVRLFLQLVKNDFKKLCRSNALPAVLLVFCILIPAVLAGFAGNLTIDSANFDIFKLAICSEDDDDLSGELAGYLANMQDIRQYCVISSCEYDKGINDLRNGELDGLLILPGGFIDGVLYGTNPDVDLIVSGSNPLKSLLLYWVGSSAAKLLTSAQAGIYAVLDTYDAIKPLGINRNDVLLDINLIYINKTLNRENMFKISKLESTTALSLPAHYYCDFVCYLMLALAPLCMAIFAPARFKQTKRLKSAGHGSVSSALSGMFAYALCCLPASLSMTIICSVIENFSFYGSPRGVLKLIVASCLLAFFCGAFAAFAAILMGKASDCSIISFLFSLAGLALAGGILPPFLLPESIRSKVYISPICGLESITAWIGGRPLDKSVVILSIWFAIFVIGACLLCVRKVEEVNE